MTDHRIVTHDEWVATRKRFLEKEKELTRLRDELSRERRELPWERVTKVYEFETEKGKETLADLFDGHSQLLVYHFMFAPEWEIGCKSCSFWADNFNGIIEHLEHRDVAFAAISRAPLAKLQAQARKQEWSFKWVSCGDNDFNYDYCVSFAPEARAAGTTTYNYETRQMKNSDMPGVSAFIKDGGHVFHTYSTYGRGIDMVNTAYHYLDLAPKGRDEAGLSYPMEWVRHRFKYGT